MIAVIPALEFMRALSGTYRASGAQVLRVWKCGYGVALDFQVGETSQWVCVVGAFHQTVECFAHFGLPNVVRLTGEMQSATSLTLTADDELPISLTLSGSMKEINVKVIFNGEERASRVLARVDAKS
jgi:hypothetical protein